MLGMFVPDLSLKLFIGVLLVNHSVCMCMHLICSYIVAQFTLLNKHIFPSLIK